MSYSFKFMIWEYEGMSNVMEEKQFVNMSMDPEKIKDYFGDDAEWKEVWLNEANYGRKLAIDRLSSVVNIQDGSSYTDATRIASARIVTMVEKWNGFVVSPSFEYLETLPTAVVEYIDGKIREYMYPTASKVPSFIEAWNARQKPSGKGNPSESTESTKES
jgi:hypothetical protein